MQAPIHHKFYDLYLDDEGIMVLKFKNDVFLELEDVIQLTDDCETVAGEVPRPLLIITGDRLGVSKEGRSIDISERRKKNTLAEAMVIDNLATRLTAKIYKKFNPPPIEAQHFKTEEEAREWLRLKLKENESTELH